MSRRRAFIAAAVAAALSLVLPPGAEANCGGGDEYEAYVLGTLRWTRSLPAALLKHSSPAIVDINGDGSNDVVVGGLDGRVYAFDANGNNLPGWPATATGAVPSSPAVGDLNGDGFNGVAVGTGSLEVAGTARQGPSTSSTATAPCAARRRRLSTTRSRPCSTPPPSGTSTATD